jgi:hypothetical protein
MKNTLLLICIIVASCCGAKKTNGTTSADTAVASGEMTDTAACIREMIAGFKNEEKQNPPRKIYSYTYKGQTVYYVTPPCCDFFSDLYDSKCKLIGHPDGGITGKGDGKFTDFEKTKTNEKLVWEDTRK